MICFKCGRVGQKDYGHPEKLMGNSYLPPPPLLLPYTQTTLVALK